MVLNLTVKKTIDDRERERDSYFDYRNPYLHCHTNHYFDTFVGWVEVFKVF